MCNDFELCKNKNTNAEENRYFILLDDAYVPACKAQMEQFLLPELKIYRDTEVQNAEMCP